MSLSRGTLSQIKTAYKSVFGVDDIDEQALVRIGNEILAYAQKLPFEDDNLLAMRLVSIQDISDKDNIGMYLSNIPDDVFSGEQMSTYGKLFELAKKFNMCEASTTEVQAPSFDAPTGVSNNSIADFDESGYTHEMEEPTSNGTTSDASDSEERPTVETIETNNPKIKEEENMNAIEKLAKEAGATGVGTDMPSSNTIEVSKNDRAAAMKLVESTQTDRMNYSNKAKITKILITQISREKKAVEGKNAMGKVSNPKKALNTFMTKTGADVKDGVITFSKLAPGQSSDDAKKMYEVLKQAADVDPNTPVQPYFGAEKDEVPVIIKGVTIVDPAGKTIDLAQKDLAAHILQHAFLYLSVESKSGAQVILDAATKRGGSTPKKTYVLKFANKKDLLADTSVLVPVKILTDKPSDSKTGFKSAMAVVCNSSKLDANGTPKKVTWRIPLEVDQFEVKTVEQYSNLFKSGVGTTKPISATDAKDIEAIVSKISTLIAAEAAKSSDSSILGATMTSQLKQEKDKLVNEDANAINQVLEDNSSEADFEG